MTYLVRWIFFIVFSLFNLSNCFALRLSNHRSPANKRHYMLNL